MSEQVDALSHHAMVCLPVEVQNRIVRYAVQDILEESESQSKAVALCEFGFRPNPLDAVLSSSLSLFCYIKC
jgi:hypothetical protein